MDVKRYFLKWTREWARVLKPGGFALVVTICCQHFETQVVGKMHGRLVIEEAVQFDNKGFTQCRLYTVRKPLAWEPPARAKKIAATGAGKMTASDVHPRSSSARSTTALHPLPHLIVDTRTCSMLAAASCVAA